MRADSGRRVPARVRAGRVRVSALIAVLAGLVLVAAGLVGWRYSRSDVAEVGVGDAIRLTTPGPTQRPARDEVPVTDGRQLSRHAANPPARLAIPAISLTAPVEQVGIVPDSGEFQVPSDVDIVGWYRFGPGLEATAGSIVIAGHVDGAGQGEGAFFRLAELAPGDRIELLDAAGTRFAFDVVAREVHPKNELPLARYFSRSGPVRLTLITCGGEFDSGSRRYADNIVVTAEPVR
jgi:hypothetical protein